MSNMHIAKGFSIFLRKQFFFCLFHSIFIQDVCHETGEIPVTEEQIYETEEELRALHEMEDENTNAGKFM